MQTISFTIKKATVIYLKAISSLLFILLSFQSFAAEDLASFCFARGTNLREAQKSLEFLLLPREQVFLRPEDGCFDVTTSPDRVKLLEKFLSKRYTLESEKSEPSLANCQLELKTIRKRNVDTKDFRVGSNNNVIVGSKSTDEVSTSQLLLGLGKPGTLELEGRTLLVECRGGGRGIYQLVFSYNEEARSKVSSEVSVRQGEVINIAQITKDLNEKSKSLGLPQSIYQEAKGAENISYELMIK